MKKYLILLILIYSTCCCRSQDTLPNDTFVTASLLIATPSPVLYSCSGHVFWRMQCPSEGLDYCFSYEAEDVTKKTLTFLRGKLKMGLLAIPTEQFIKVYKNDGRGLLQYDLQLPIAVKQNLWRVLDEHAAEGIDLPYDFIRRGCAQSCVTMLKEALGDTLHIEYAPWDKRFSSTRRELVADVITDFPWNTLFLYTLVGSDIDKECPMEAKLVTPTDLVEVWQQARVQGEPLLARIPKVVLQQKNQNITRRTWIKPWHIALLLSLLAILNLWWRKPFVDLLLLILQTTIGILLFYLIFLSALPATSWNWLFVPLNPLPCLLWRWHRYWALPAAGVLFLWAATILLLPHAITDNAYILLDLAIATSYIGIAFGRKMQPRSNF